MRIAVLADIHGNRPALAAVLADAERLRADRLYVLGDVINGGPEPAACWRVVRARADGIVRGNHERYVLSARTGDPRFGSDAWGPAHWTAGRMEHVDLEQIARLPPTIELDAGPPSGTLLVHASPRADDDTIVPGTPDAAIRPLLAGVAAATMVRGHNHVAFDRTVEGVRIVGLGAVGLPFGDPVRAEYAVLDETPAGWSVDHRRVPYDVEATLRACRDTGYLAEAGPIARLFAAEIATGRKHLSMFMREVWAPAGEHSLAEAVDAFLRRSPAARGRWSP